MRSLSFRSRDVLLKVDEATLIEDIRSEPEKAARKLEALQEHRKSYIERTALEIERLTAAEAKFGAAVRRLSNPTSLQWFGRCRHPIRRGSGNGPQNYQGARAMKRRRQSHRKRNRQRLAAQARRLGR